MKTHKKTSNILSEILALGVPEAVPHESTSDLAPASSPTPTPGPVSTPTDTVSTPQ